MRTLYTWLILPLVITLTSCEGRTGYLDEGQQNTIAMLTDVEWVTVYAQYWHNNEQTFDNETSIYSFGIDTKGWTALGSLIDPSVKKNVRHFQWAFTTENYAVIYTAGDSNEGYWLIQKLTPTEMWLQWSAQDPVLYPNQTTTFYKFKARKRL